MERARARCGGRPRAINRVLAAEREAANAIESAQREADALIEAARTERRRLIESARVPRRPPALGRTVPARALARPARARSGRTRDGRRHAAGPHQTRGSTASRGGSRLQAMSRADLSFAYAQSRLQARLGARPAAADWQQFEATRDLGALLQVLRGGPLAHWTARLPARAGLHEIERQLRDEWRHAVAEVAYWQPAHWREATLWMRWISYLPALQKLARGGRAPAWMRADPVLGPIGGARAPRADRSARKPRRSRRWPRASRCRRTSRGAGLCTGSRCGPRRRPRGLPW